MENITVILLKVFGLAGVAKLSFDSCFPSHLVQAEARKEKENCRLKGWYMQRLISPQTDTRGDIPQG